MAIGTNDVIRVAARGHLPLVGDLVNVFHLKIGSGTIDAESVVIDAILDWVETIYTPIMGFMSSSCTVTDINIFNVTQNQPVGSFAWPTLVGGSQGGDILPSTIAGFVRATTGISRNWAKKFVWPMAESANDGQGFVAAAAMTALMDFGAAWIAPFTLPLGVNVHPVVFHAATGTWNTVTEIIVRNVWANMRTRRPGRGS